MAVRLAPAPRPSAIQLRELQCIFAGEPQWHLLSATAQCEAASLLFAGVPMPVCLLPPCCLALPSCPALLSLLFLPSFFFPASFRLPDPFFVSQSFYHPPSLLPLTFPHLLFFLLFFFFLLSQVHSACQILVSTQFSNQISIYTGW